MKIIIYLVRNLLGGFIALLDLVTRGRALRRDSEIQKVVAKEAQSLSLYQFFACPFCIKTRRAIYKMNLPIEKRSISQGSPYRQELKDAAGKVQAPCLRIENGQDVEWLYDSKAIIAYLEQRFLNA